MIMNDEISELLEAAMYKEVAANAFFSQMMSFFRSQQARKLCLWLVQEETGHKLKLESFYDDFIYSEE
jgi:rubrerythrin